MGGEGERPSGPDARPSRAVIAVSRDGKTTVITGWRAWLIGAAVFVALCLVFAVVAFVVLGVALTVTAVLLIVVPIAVGVALLVSVFRRP
jgi:hypothetical protein